MSDNPLLFTRKLSDMLKNWNTILIELKVVCHDQTMVKGGKEKMVRQEEYWSGERSFGTSRF